MFEVKVSDFNREDTKLLKNIESLLIENNNLLRQAFFSKEDVQSEKQVKKKEVVKPVVKNNKVTGGRKNEPKK